MTLTDQEKEDLKLLCKSRGFAVVEKIAKDLESNLFKEFKTASFGNMEVVEKLTQKQNYLKGTEDLIHIIKSSHSTVGKRNKD